MRKKIKYFLIGFFALLLIPCLSACDLGINNIPGNTNPSGGSGIDIMQFLDAKKSYENLYKDLNYMYENCLNNEKLAGAQAYTILMSYGLADMSKEASSFTSQQFQTKTELFDAIKLINTYANNFTSDFISFYNPILLQSWTQQAMKLCEKMISYL